MGFNLEDEEPYQDYTRILSRKIGQMRIDIKNGVMSDKSSGKRKLFK